MFEKAYVLSKSDFESTSPYKSIHILGAGGDEHVIEGEMVNLPEPSIDEPCPPDYNSFDEIAADFTSGMLRTFESFKS